MALFHFAMCVSLWAGVILPYGSYNYPYASVRAWGGRDCDNSADYLIYDTEAVAGCWDHSSIYCDYFYGPGYGNEQSCSKLNIDFSGIVSLHTAASFFIYGSIVLHFISLLVISFWDARAAACGHRLRSPYRGLTLTLMIISIISMSLAVSFVAQVTHFDLLRGRPIFYIVMMFVQIIATVFSCCYKGGEEIDSEPFEVPSESSGLMAGGYSVTPVDGVHAIGTETAIGYHLLVNVPGQHPVALQLSPNSVKDLHMQLSQKLDLHEEFDILYVDPEFQANTRLIDLAHLPPKTQITIAPRQVALEM
eukprot:TRINITY_DN1902_c0_g1_i1.p1 TRINITY_DN1902_c0_g1~~TRINITY_DN1902_c0_g1_i1.p1  ORF type:complete len:357 (+),score=57.47 TRINITY_DN1902_c0_g1_i1:154-1071(+)